MLWFCSQFVLIQFSCRVNCNSAQLLKLEYPSQFVHQKDDLCQSMIFFSSFLFDNQPFWSSANCHLFNFVPFNDDVVFVNELASVKELEMEQVVLLRQDDHVVSHQGDLGQRFWIDFAVDGWIKKIFLETRSDTLVSWRTAPRLSELDDNCFVDSFRNGIMPDTLSSTCEQDIDKNEGRQNQQRGRCDTSCMSLV